MVECCKRRIWRYKPSDTPGLNYRWWDATNGPHLDPLEWTGPADPVTGFPLPTSAAPNFTGINNNTSISDSNSGAGAARYGIIHGWVWLPDDVTHWRDNNSNTGELGMVLSGSCCGGALVEQPGGNHSASTVTADRSLMDPTPVAGGWHFVYNPQSDTSAFQGLDLEYSTDGGTSWTDVSVMRPDLPEIQGFDIGCCQAIPDGWSADPLQECCQPVYQAGGGLDEAAVQALIDEQDHIELCAEQAVVDTGLTYLAPTIHRRGYAGTDGEAMRCDAVDATPRINPTPLTPEVTYSGVGTMTNVLVLDRWSSEHSVGYAWRVLVTQDPGTGWGFVTIPNIAGFQRPKISGVGTYRPASTAVQEDGSGNTNNQSTEGASPRGPYMGSEAHHWSSTQRIYAGYFRRDNQYRAYIEFIADYECL